MKKVTAIIANNDREWDEDFNVNDEREVQIIIDRFNAGLRPGEHPRRLVSIKKAEQKTIATYTWADIKRDVIVFMVQVRWENNNAYGNRGVKSDYKKIETASENFLSGKFGVFIRYVKSHHRICTEDLSLLMSLDKKLYELIYLNN